MSTVFPRHIRRVILLWVVGLLGACGTARASAPDARTPVRWLDDAAAGAARACAAPAAATSNPRSTTKTAPTSVGGGERWSAPALAWNELLLELIVKYQQNPLRAARNLALLHAALHDALLLCGQCTDAAVRLALHAAASGVLEHLYPDESPGRFGALARAAAATDAAASVAAAEVQRAWSAGCRAGAAAIWRALDDGADLPRLPAERPAERPGIWRAAPPLNSADPTEPRAAQWRTWVLSSGAELQPPPPPPYGSALHRAEVEEVLRVARQLTPAQRQLALEWNLDLGTVTPAGVWNRQARRLAVDSAMDQAQTVRLLAALNVAMADAFIACWQAKYQWWSERPVTVIRRELQADFLPLIITPPFPSYVSGHATASGAAATVLAAFFPPRAAALQRLAEEAAESRLYGGIHTRSDNAAGLALGRAIGARVLGRLFPQDLDLHRPQGDADDAGGAR